MRRALKRSSGSKSGPGFLQRCSRQLIQMTGNHGNFSCINRVTRLRKMGELCFDSRASVKIDWIVFCLTCKFKLSYTQPSRMKPLSTIAFARFPDRCRRIAPFFQSSRQIWQPFMRSIPQFSPCRRRQCTRYTAFLFYADL